jgi:hypothetical protein
MTLVEIISQPYYSPAGIVNAGEICGLPDAVATALIAAGGAVLYNAGSGAGAPTASPFRGIGEAETPSEYEAAGGTLGDQTVSAAIQGYIGETTIVDGRAVPDSEASWA